MRRRASPGGVVIGLLVVHFFATWQVRAQGMDVTLEVKLKESQLVHQQSVECTVVLHNNSRNVLHDVNPENIGGGPTMILTDMETDQTTRFMTLKKPGAAYRPIDVSAGSTTDSVFFLTQLVQFPGPGSYELQAEYVWDNGRHTTLSPPARIELLPNNLKPHHIVSPKGGASSLYLAVCSQESQAKPGMFELWLASFTTSKRPRVHNLVRLENVKEQVKPYLSVAANTQPTVQWLAWIENQKLAYLANVPGQDSDVKKAKLDKRDWTIVPPVLQNPTGRGQQVPGADVLLYSRDPDAAAGTLQVLSVDTDGTVMGRDVLAIPGLMPTWWETAHVKSVRRFTFLAMSSGDETKLAVAQWAALGTPKTLEELATWPGHCIGGDTWVTPDDLIVGAVVIGSGDPKKPDYAFHTWNMSPLGQVQLAPAVPIAVPEGIKLRRAIVSVNIGQDPFAILEAGTQSGPWYYAASDGSVKSVPIEIASNGGVPTKVLFRREVDPTIMYHRPGWGFDFIKP